MHMCLYAYMCVRVVRVCVDICVRIFVCFNACTYILCAYLYICV